MNRLLYSLVWLSRLHRCRGFGIQSPSDYRFARYVINEHWPYYAYAKLGLADDWLTRKIGLLCFRLANYLQPRTVVGQRYGEYIQAGCRKAQLVNQADKADLAIVSGAKEFEAVLPCCTTTSVVVIENISKEPQLWKNIVADTRTGVTFDLYYCGIVMFDTARNKQNYIINF